MPLKGKTVPHLQQRGSHNPYSLLPVPYSLFPAPCSLLPAPSSLLPVLYSLLPTPLKCKISRNPLPWRMGCAIMTLA